MKEAEAEGIDDDDDEDDGSGSDFLEAGGGGRPGVSEYEVIGVVVNAIIERDGCLGWLLRFFFPWWLISDDGKRALSLSLF